MKKSSYLVSLAAVVVAAIFSVRIGAIMLAGALALFALPGIKNRRRVEQIFPIALILLLITLALALPRS